MKYAAPRNPLGLNGYDWIDDHERAAMRKRALMRKRAASKKRRDANRAARRCINDPSARTHAAPRVGRTKCDACLEMR